MTAHGVHNKRSIRNTYQIRNWGFVYLLTNSLTYHAGPAAHAGPFIKCSYNSLIGENRADIINRRQYSDRALQAELHRKSRRDAEQDTD